MKTSPITPDDFGRSVLAVPPLARNADFSLNRDENAKLIRYLEDGGISTLVYGGNANFYNIGVGEYASVVTMLSELAHDTSLVIPALGPDFGKAMDQAEILGKLNFPTALMLPLGFPATPAGTEIGIRKIAGAFGKPVICYIKSDAYIEPEAVARLIDDGHVCGVKYAIVREDPAVDEYLSRLIECIGGRLIISGIGERPAIAHLRDFGLAGFTSGSVCIAPRASSAMLRALQAEDYETAARLRARFLPFEDQRDAISPLRVLHDGVTLAGIGEMGPLLPMLTGISGIEREAVAKAAEDLKAFDATMDGHRPAA